MDRPFTVIAIVAAYNEADIIGQVLADLIDQGVSVYLLDNLSTDATVEIAGQYLGRGLIAIERFSGAGTSDVEAEQFSLAAIVARKQTLAAELEADWFINHDADEFRESPWRHLNLLNGIQLVDSLGFNTIDFELLNFWPTHDGFHPDQDIRLTFPRYQFGDPWDKVQIRCWKKLPGPVDLASAGHEARFAGRAVFPIRFILRHYPIRSQAHGERKVFHERKPRFAPSERAKSWHVQYDSVHDGHIFLRDPETLTPYDADAIRVHLALRHRDVESLESTVDALQRRIQDLNGRVADLESRERELQEVLSVTVATNRAEVQRYETALAASEEQLDAVFQSRSWRLTAPLRAAQRLLQRR